jgi:hypothetical protein
MYINTYCTSIEKSLVLFARSVSRCMDMLFHITTATSYFAANGPHPALATNPTPNPIPAFALSASSGSLNTNTPAVGHPTAPSVSNPAVGDTSSAGGPGSNSNLAAGKCISNQSNQLSLPVVHIRNSLPYALIYMYTGTSIRIAGISGRILSNNHAIIAKVVEGSQKAGQILSILLTQPEFSEKFRSMRTDLYSAACSDDTIAGM